MKNTKQYAVECLGTYRHGKYGKDFYFGLYVPAYSKKDAIEAAITVVAEMSFDDIVEATIDENKCFWTQLVGHNYSKDKSQPVGLEFVETFFSFRPYIEQPSKAMTWQEYSEIANNAERKDTNV